MSKYEKLDAVILSAIDSKPKAFSTIFAGDVKAESERAAKEAGTLRSPYGVEPERVMDRRLQALRKANKIEYTGKGWVRAEAKA